MMGHLIPLDTVPTLLSLIFLIPFQTVFDNPVSFPAYCLCRTLLCELFCQFFYLSYVLVVHS